MLIHHYDRMQALVCSIGKWELEPLASLHHSLCQLNPSEEVHCPPSGTACFGFVSTAMVFQEADDHCKQIGAQRGMFGSLMEPRDDYGTDFLVRNYAALKWRCLESGSQALSGRPWVGAFRNIEVDDAHFYFLKYYEEIGETG